MKKRGVIATAKQRPAPAVLVQQLDLLAAVALKVLAMGRAPEAERLLAPAVTHFQEFARQAATHDDLEALARMHAVLAPVLMRIEAATGKPWTRSLEIVKLKSWQVRLPPRGNG